MEQLFSGPSTGQLILTIDFIPVILCCLPHLRGMITTIGLSLEMPGGQGSTRNVLSWKISSYHDTSFINRASSPEGCDLIYCKQEKSWYVKNVGYMRQAFPSAGNKHKLVVTGTHAPLRSQWKKEVADIISTSSRKNDDAHLICGSGWQICLSYSFTIINRQDCIYNSPWNPRARLV